MTHTVNRLPSDEGLGRVKAKVVTCPACGGLRLNYEGPHAPRITRDPASGLVVRADCVGHVLEILDAE